MASLASMELWRSNSTIHDRQNHGSIETWQISTLTILEKFSFPIKYLPNDFNKTTKTWNSNKVRKKLETLLSPTLEQLPCDLHEEISGKNISQINFCLLASGEKVGWNWVSVVALLVWWTSTAHVSTCLFFCSSCSFRLVDITAKTEMLNEMKKTKHPFLADIELHSLRPSSR